MIETPTATAYTVTTESDSADADAPLSDDQKSEKQKLRALEAELLLVKQAPITSKLRTAVKHICGIAGPLARFRGLHIAILYGLIHGLAVNLIGGPTSSIARPIVSVVTSIVLCRIQMTLTHVIISMPSTKHWWQRYPSFKAAKNIIIPTAIWAIARQISVYVPGMLFAIVFDKYQRPAQHGNPHTVQKMALVQLFCVILVSIATVFLIVIPADVTLKRVQASMLPEEDEAIVPFDRTFAGRVTPEALGGSGSVSMLDAWKTFDKAGRLRVIKLYVKLFAIQIAVTVMFAMMLLGELRLIMGGDFEKVLAVARKSVRGEL